MSTDAIDEENLKELRRLALAALLEEHCVLTEDAIEEAMEDIALARAIEQGRNSKKASRDEVFAYLD
ncbi:MAG: hypothetical protein WCB68_16715 [Pyrinomonadaceae bacterium]